MAAVGLLPAAASAATYTVTSTADDGSAGTLRYAINQANANPGSTINFAANLGGISLTSALPPINASMSINGASGDGGISGSNQYRIFLVNSGTVAISNLTLKNGLAQGGNGGDGSGGGGGGLGAGGAIFIRGNDGGRTAPTVTLTNLNLVNNQAVGGNGGAGVSSDKAGGGGGGLGGNGGNGQNYAGGGGGGFPGENGDSGITQPGNGTGPDGDDAAPGQTGGDFHGGGGAQQTKTALGGAGGYGGGAGGASAIYDGTINRDTDGGAGGFGGGGGGGDGSFGGFGGGGGSTGPTHPENTFGVVGGFAAGSGSGVYGGGGAGLGGAVFAAAGAAVTFVGGSVSGNTTAGGLDGDGGNAATATGGNILTSGTAYGDGVFLQGGTATYSVAAGLTQTLTQSVYGAGSDGAASPNGGSSALDQTNIDLSGSAITKTGAGVLQVATDLRYGGTTVVNQGVLDVGTGGLLGSGSATVNAGGELRIDGSGVVNDLATTHDGGGYTSVNTITVNGTATVPGVLTVTDTAAITNEPFIVIGNTGLGVFNLSGGSVQLTGGLTLGQATGSVGTFNVSGGGQIGGNQLIVGYNAGSGVVHQTAGFVLFSELQLGQGGTGTYALSGSSSYGADSYLQIGNDSTGPNVSIGTNAGATGTLTVTGGELNAVANLFVGQQGAGTVNQSGGTVVVQGQAELGNGPNSTGHYVLSGTGETDTHSFIVGAQGQADFTQTGGSLFVQYALYFNSPAARAFETSGDGTLYVGLTGQGRFSLAGGTVTADKLLVADYPGGTDVFAQSGGTLTTTASVVGVSGVGLFNQSAGTHTVNGTLTVGQYNVATGTYNLTGGTLTAQAAAAGPTTYLTSNASGYAPTGAYRGTFAQTAGSFTVAGNLDLATLAGGTALYTLSGSATAANVSSAALRVGVGGTALFSQTGGTNTVTGDLSLADDAGAVGTYNLSGGVLQAGSISLGVGSLGTLGFGNPAVATFTQTGGTATVAGTLALGVGSQSQATYTMTGGGLTTGQTNLGLTPASSGSISFSSPGTGTFNQTGGVHTVGTLTVGPTGTYNLVGGGTGFPPTLQAGTIAGQNGGGTFLVDGGILRPSADNATWISGQNVSIGAGAISVLTDGYNVTITSNLLHNAALGTARDGGLGVGNGTGAAGTGSLTLTGTSNYTGDTRVTAGATLYYNAFSFTGAGSSIIVNGGVLGGTADTDSQGLIGTQYGFGTGVIAPGATAASVGNFTFNGAAVQIGPYGTYDADVDSGAKNALQQSDTITATGVTLSPGATLVLDDLSPTTALPAGTVLTLIDNDSIGQIVGAFSNLADGATVTVGENTFVADYEGGDGNDLTLTVAAPEPTTLLLVAGPLALTALARRRRR